MSDGKLYHNYHFSFDLEFIIYMDSLYYVLLRGVFKLIKEINHFCGWAYQLSWMLSITNAAVHIPLIIKTIPPIVNICL